MAGRRAVALRNELGLELEMALEEFAPRVGVRGREYAASGAVVSLQAAPRRIEAVVVGTVLADDMGLGKTLQALAWLAHLRETDPEGGPSLVVCPASVVHNWQREAERFTPGLRVLVLERGPERHALRTELASHDLLVTTYALLRQDVEAWSGVPLRAAILDEAQNVKNPDAATSRAALALRARHRLALTGTPLENRALDLWSIMAFVNPGLLGPRAAFSGRYDRADAPPHARALLAARLRPVLLRRLKCEVAPELPPRIEERRDCELTPGQRRLYLAELQRSGAAPGGHPPPRADGRDDATGGGGRRLHGRRGGLRLPDLAARGRHGAQPHGGHLRGALRPLDLAFLLADPS